MENVWKGMFSPNIRKSIGTVTYVPLVDMSPRDWDWLDYNGIRTVARNRIDSCVLQGNLLGFFRVMITEKAAKNEYLWQVTQELLDEFQDNDNASFFGHEAEALTEAQAVARLEELRAGMFMVPLPILTRVMELVNRLSRDKQKKEQLNKVEEDYLEAFDRETVQFIVSSVMLWEMSLAEAEAVLDDLPDYDDVDAAKDWVRSMQAQIQRARADSMTLAASRDLTGTPESVKIVK